jgi:hypothetical protein
VANALFFQELHDTAGGIQSKGASPGQKHAMNSLYLGCWVQKVCLSRSWGAPSNVHTADGPRFTNNNGAARGRITVFSVTNLNAFYVGEFDFLHGPTNIPLFGDDSQQADVMSLMTPPSGKSSFCWMIGGWQSYAQYRRMASQRPGIV